MSAFVTRRNSDAHRAMPKGMNLDSVLSLRVSRTVTADYRVRWDSVIYRIEREQIRAGMRGARVQLERRRDGSRWIHWRKRVVALERCETPPRALAKRPVQSGVSLVRSAGEKARAKQRLLDGRQRWRESFHHTSRSTDLAGGERFSVARARASIAMGEGQGIQTPSLAPRAPPSRLQKRNFLSCGEAELSTLR
jgi:hypothetical protein